MPEFLSLGEADHLAEESSSFARPGLDRVFVGMIRRPGETLADAFSHPLQSYASCFAAAGGVYWALNLSIAQPSGDGMALPMLLAAILLIGLPAGIAYLFALSILIHWSCDILGGKPTRKKIRMMLAYVGVPGIIALVLFGLPKVVLFGRTLFMPERAWLSANPVLVWGLWFGDALCFAWSLMLVVKALKLMNGFSTARAVAAAALPLCPIVLIGVLFFLIVWSGVFFAPPAF